VRDGIRPRDTLGVMDVGAPLLVVAISDDTGRSVVEVTGEVDLTTADNLSSSLDQAIDGGGGDVVVDLAGVVFLDSTGIAVLTRAWRRLEGTDRVLSVRHPADNVRRVLEICGLDRIIPIGS
jgi:anti-sigma B factor antagonist